MHVLIEIIRPRLDTELILNSVWNGRVDLPINELHKFYLYRDVHRSNSLLVDDIQK